jgi:hypothetical protein
VRDDRRFAKSGKALWRMDILAEILVQFSFREVICDAGDGADNPTDKLTDV